VIARRLKVVVTDQVFPSVDIERQLLDGIGVDLVIADGTREDVVRQARDADGLLNTYLPIDAELIRACERLRIIARYGIGVDNVDVAAATDAGIVVTNVPDYSVEEVAAHALAMILALCRRLPSADALVRTGGWGISALRPIRRLSAMTFGLVGYGRIARRLASSINALGASIVVHDPFLGSGADGPELLSLEDLLDRSDVVSVHAPLTDDTRALFNARRFAQMRPGAIFVNTSRGPLVVLGELIEALRSGHLAGAGLDVFESEPLPVGLIDDVPNLLVSPHMAYYSEESLQESQHKAATQVVKALTGEPVDYPVAP
jgi:D-3-phosphoglycerate dehydrogenase